MDAERRHLTAAIRRQRAIVLDLECVVDACRRAIDADLLEFHAAVLERDRGALYLGYLLELYHDCRDGRGRP